MEKTIRELLREGYGMEPQKVTTPVVDYKEVDSDKLSSIQRMSWGYKRLIEQANADNQND